MARVLIIDDDRMICDVMAQLMNGMGHEASCALTLKDGLKQAAATEFDVVFLDVRLPDGSGLEALPQIRETASAPEVIIMTGMSDPQGAELAIRSGAWDYVQKNFSSRDELTLLLKRALQYRREKRAAKPRPLFKPLGIVGGAPRLRACLELAAQAAASEANTLITGETGTGKELFARAIHDNSARSNRSFVVVDCTVLPETLVESLLFGHEKGAFTGADQVREGLVKQAHGGTLFLDEVGELPLTVQKAFLRVLQEHRFRPLGGKSEIESEFRLVAATHRDLDKMVREGQFRQDLLFRLRSLVIELPPLRDRSEDIPELLLDHMARLCRRYGMGTKGFSPDFLAALRSHNWPGNVRELFNAVERALVAAQNEPTLFPKHLPTEIRIELTRRSLHEQGSAPAVPLETSGAFPSWRTTREAGLSRLESQYLADLLAYAGGDVNRACEISGLKRSRLYQLIKKHELLGRD